MTHQISSTVTVYSVTEVAEALRVSSETVRRKIVAGELSAIELGGGRRKQYRILAKDLAAWLGAENAEAVFGIGAGLEALRALFAPLSAEERETLLGEAVTWAKSQRPEPEFVGKTLSAEDVANRFAE